MAMPEDSLPAVISQISIGEDTIPSSPIVGLTDEENTSSSISMDLGVPGSWAKVVAKKRPLSPGSAECSQSKLSALPDSSDDEDSQ